jgi:hypothetical protein
MKLIKLWGWRQDIRYYLYQHPIEIIRALIGIAKKDHLLNEFTWIQYIEFAASLADMKSGRFYRVVFEE